MKFTVFSTIVVVLAIAALFIESSNALSHPLELIVTSVDRQSQNVASFLVKRKSHSKDKNKDKNKSKNKKEKNRNKNKKKDQSKTKDKKRKYSSDCSKRSCPLKLPACPKDCPQSCGYLDSPDPCCPLLGKPTCPDY